MSKMINTVAWSVNTMFDARKSGTFASVTFIGKTMQNTETGELLVSVKTKNKNEIYIPIDRFCKTGDVDWLIALKPEGKKFRFINGFYVLEYADITERFYVLESTIEYALHLDTQYPELGFPRCWIKAVKDIKDI